MICEDQILYLDNHLLVLDKPGGIPTQPPPDGAPGISLEEQAKDYLKKKFNKPGNVFLQAVHRIDKAVSGVVIFARTSKALSRMGEQMRAGQISKIYLALVEGKATGQGIKLEDWLLHCERRARICTQMTKDAKLSQLVYDVMQQTDNFSLLKIHLITGRYHQIRIQLAHAKLHIVGDTKYGAKTQWLPLGSIALQSHEMTIRHPVTEETMTFVSQQHLNIDKIQ